MEREFTASIPEHILHLLNGSKEGQILCVGSSGVYLQFGQQILLLCDQSWGILPIGIGIKDFRDVTGQLHLQPEQTVTVLENRLIFPESSILLLPANTDFRESTGAVPQLSRIRQAAQALAALQKDRGISMLVQPLVLDCRLRQPNPYCLQAETYLKKLTQALIEDNRDALSICLGKLLGLGPGLTPSADDVLLGMLYVFRKLPRKCPASVDFFRKQILQMCDHRTNKVSAAYLKAITNGAPFERMERVFRGICGEQPLNIEILTQIGSSSGSEMLLGMLIALRVCGYAVNMREESL